MPINQEQMSTWITVQDNKVCPDCSALAGKTMTMSEWVESGVLPGNGQTVCGDFCRCVIVPEDWADDFGVDRIVDISLEKVTDLLTSAIPVKIGLRWEVTMEAEIGFSADVAEDLVRTLEMFNSNPAELEKLYPNRFKQIKKILGK